MAREWIPRPCDRRASDLSCGGTAGSPWDSEQLSSQDPGCPGDRDQPSAPTRCSSSWPATALGWSGGAWLIRNPRCPRERVARRGIVPSHQPWSLLDQPGFPQGQRNLTWASIGPSRQQALAERLARWHGSRGRPRAWDPEPLVSGQRPPRAWGGEGSPVVRPERGRHAQAIPFEPKACLPRKNAAGQPVPPGPPLRPSRLT